MNDNVEINIRTVKKSDIENLKSFFIKANGEQTIFQNNFFLTYYFNASLNNKPVFSNSLIGVTKSGEIVSHYGGLEYNISIEKKKYPLVWGVSAYTLQEYRGKGSNSQIVDFITNNNVFSGVIGFTRKAAEFYSKLGYNLFDFKRFTRYILILNSKKSLEISNSIKQISNDFFTQKHLSRKNFIANTPNEVIEITLENIRTFKLSLYNDFPNLFTTVRTEQFLKWRFLEHPFIKYKIYGFVNNNLISGYIVSRVEKLEPFNYEANRIIDLFGDNITVKALINKVIKNSIREEHIYIDFSMFGSIYDEQLKSFNFSRLENEDCCILPQVTSPIENRPNREYIGIYSKTQHNVVNKLTIDNVYFTRMDSDRDRLANINQIKKIEF